MHLKKRKRSGARILVLLCIPFLFFSEIVQVFLDNSIVNYYDELIVVALFLLSFSLGENLRKIPLLLIVPFGILFLTIIFSFFNFYPGFSTVILQSFINFKLFFLWFGLLLIFRERKISAKSILFLLWWISAFGFLVNFIFLESYYDLFKSVSVRERFGFTRIEGFQLKPNDLGLFLSLFFFFISYQFFSDRLSFNRYAFYGLLSIAMIVFTGSRVAMMGVFLALLVNYRFKNFLSAIPVMGLCLGLVLLIFSEFGLEIFERTKVELSSFETIEHTKYIRGIMIYYGVVLAVQYFPIGVGAGNYGTALSKDSEVYTYLGLGHLEFFEDFWGIFDSNVASLLGEYGFLITMAVIWTFVSIVKLIPNILNPAREIKRFERNTIGVVIFSLIVMMTNPLFMHHYTALCILLVLIAQAQTPRSC